MLHFVRPWVVLVGVLQFLLGGPIFLTFFFGRLVFFFGALAWSFLEFLLKIEFSRRASSNFHKTSCFSVKLLQISIKNPLKLVFSSNEEGRKEGRKEPPAVFERHRLAIAHLDIIS